MHKKIKWLIAIIVVALVAGSAYFYETSKTSSTSKVTTSKVRSASAVKKISILV